VILDPAIHDRAVAAISHLPYTVAVALVQAVTAAGDDVAWSLAASGFRDTTRLAASDVDMMLDILLTNREVVLDWLDIYAGQLAALHSALAAGDEQSLRGQLAAAQARRANLNL
jgi:prephenate dehydrogenase